MPKHTVPGSTGEASGGDYGSGGTDGARPAQGSLFGPADDNTVRGEVLIRLAAPSMRSISASIPTGPLRGLARGVPSRFGIPDLDAVLQRHGAIAVARLHPPMSDLAATAGEARDLSSTFRVQLEDGGDAVAAVKALAAIDAVEVAEPNRWREASVTPNDPTFSGQWGLARINCPAAWDVTVGDAAIVVGIVDTGVDLDHPELAGLLLAGQDLVDLAGASPPPGTHFEGDWTVRDAQPQDEVGHGTHVAGTVACASNNSTGVAGVTWACHLLPVKVLTRVVENAPPNRVRGVGSAADIAAGIRWAADHGARVINMSLGGYSDTFVERDAVAYAVGKGVVVVAAMGNDDTTTPSFPAAYPGVIAVGATTQTDQRASFSNRGPHIGVSAPGVDVLSTVWNDGYATMSGTSMASPHVAGVAALVLSCDPTLTAAAVAAILRETAQPLRDQPADPVPNDQYGAGMVDAAAAVLRAVQPAVPALTIPPFPTQPTLGRPTMPTQPLTLPVLPTRATFLTRPLTWPLTRPTLTRPLTLPTLTRPLTWPTLTRPLTWPTLTRPTLTTLPTLTRPLTWPTLTRPTLTTLPTLTRPLTWPTLTRPTLTTLPTRPTLPTFPTRPTLPTFPTRPTLTTLPTRPTLPTFPTRPTLTTLPTRPTLTTLPTRPTLTTLPTRPTLTTLPTRPTLTTVPTRPTFTTLPTRPTLTTLPTRPTLTTLPTRPTLPTFGTLPTRPTLVTQTRPTLTFPRPTLGTIGTIAPQPFGGAEYGAEAYDPYGSGGYEYYDPYGQSGYEQEAYDPYADPYGATGYEGYESYDPYAGSYDPYGSAGYDPYGGADYDPYSAGYDPYGAGYDPSGGAGYDDPYGTAAYDPYGGAAYDPYGAAAYDPYGGYGAEAYDPYAGYYEGYEQYGY